jgi:alkyl sulfatase BDS1-like metallo-beta-lactamase superfamily hydrolase
VLTYAGPERQSASADATLNMTRATLDDINTGKLTWGEAISSGKLAVDGNAGKLYELLGLLEGFELMFNIVTP